MCEFVESNLVTEKIIGEDLPYTATKH